MNSDEYESWISRFPGWKPDSPRTLDEVKRTFATGDDARWRDLGRAHGNTHTNRFRRHLGHDMVGQPVLADDEPTMQVVDRTRAMEAQRIARAKR